MLPSSASASSSNKANGKERSVTGPNSRTVHDDDTLMVHGHGHTDEKGVPSTSTSSSGTGDGIPGAPIQPGLGGGSRKRRQKPRGRPPDRETREEFIISPSDNMKSERAQCKHCAWEKAYNLPRLRRHLASCGGFRQKVGRDRVKELCERWQVKIDTGERTGSSPGVQPPPVKKTRLTPLEDEARALRVSATASPGAMPRQPQLHHPHVQQQHQIHHSHHQAQQQQQHQHHIHHVHHQPQQQVGRHLRPEKGLVGQAALSYTTKTLQQARVVSIIRAVDRDTAVERACDLVKNCGCRAIEITRDSKDWLYVLKSVVDKVGDQAVVGVGTILDSADVATAAGAGAKFALSPVNPPGFIDACLNYDVLPIPGCYTPQEIFNATSAGANFVKIFPAQSFGLDSLRALRGISYFKGVNFLATGGIDEARAREWFAAGCAVVGMGALICGGDLGEKDPSRVAQLRQEYLVTPGGGREKARGILDRLAL